MTRENAAGLRTAARLGALLAKDYAERLLALLVNYKDISASEAASRANLHIQTAQDFLEGLTELGYLDRREVSERKRPYYRYTLVTSRMTLEVNLDDLKRRRSSGELDRRIREKANAGANFTLARDGEAIGHVAKWTGEGRGRKERRINLTESQGRFLYHLPFPNAKFLSVADIIRRARIDDQLTPEILDIVDELEALGIIEEELQSTPQRGGL